VTDTVAQRPMQVVSAAPAERDPASYRDPSGFVFRRDGTLYRQVNARFAGPWAAVRASGLLEALWSARLLVPHEEVSLDLAMTDAASAVLRPTELPVVSFAREWTFSQLQDAALATLEIQRLALERGMTLRDASASNVQFDGPRPVHIDTLSFEPLDPHAPWRAYRQFCEHFLAPLALMRYHDPAVAARLATPEGVPLAQARELLPRRTRWSPGLAAHLHLHARAQSAADAEGREPRRAGRMSLLRHQALVDHLRRTVSGLRLPTRGTTWSSYERLTSYSAQAAESKERLVAEWLGGIPAGRLLDIGANRGRYARIAEAAGHRVIAIDADGAPMDELHRSIRQSDSTITPLVVDIVNPTPSEGWGLRERPSFLERARPDTILALALVHHLAIGRNVPLRMVAELFASLAPRAIVEFVPRTDPMVERLLRDREDVFDDYTQPGFEAALGPRVVTVARQPISGSDRLLYHFERR
jgi:hypothetical protein